MLSGNKADTRNRIYRNNRDRPAEIIIIIIITRIFTGPQEANSTPATHLCYISIFDVKKIREICIAPHHEKLTSEALRYGSHCKHAIPAFTS